MDNAQTQLDGTCHAVTNSAHDFILLRRSLEDQLTQDKKTVVNPQTQQLDTVVDVLVALQQQVPLTQHVPTTIEIGSTFSEIETVTSELKIRLEELKLKHLRDTSESAGQCDSERRVQHGSAGRSG